MANLVRVAGTEQMSISSDRVSGLAKRESGFILQGLKPAALWTLSAHLKSCPGKKEDSKRGQIEVRGIPPLQQKLQNAGSSTSLRFAQNDSGQGHGASGMELAPVSSGGGRLCRWTDVTKRLLQHALVVMGLVAVSVSLHGQVLAAEGGAKATLKEPFSGYNESLERTADAMLASAPQQAPPADAGQQGVIAQDEGPVAQNQWKLSAWGVRPGPCAARVELLRPVVDPILRSYGVPAEIAAGVIFVESGGRSDALSPKGARGVWQLMPATARRFGLRVDASEDDRLDLFKATGAAAQYLHELYFRFSDWRLALAAYNAGETNVSTAILRAHSQDFDRLASLRMLPQETREYVPRVLAQVNFMRPVPGAEETLPVSGIRVFANSSQ